MQESKFISVIMPTHNMAEFLPASIASILNQTYRNFELIIIDNDSSDNTEELVNSYKDTRIRYYKIKNNGTAGAINHGVTLAYSNWIARLDADDISVPTRLEKQMTFISEHDYDVVSTWSVYFKNNRIQFFWDAPIEDKNIKDALMLHNPVNQSGMIIRKSLLEENKFNESYFYNEDFELMFRLKDKAKFYNMPEYLTYTRIHNKSKSSSADNSNILSFLKPELLDKYKEEKGKSIANKLAWMEMFYGNKSDARKLLLKSASLKNLAGLGLSFINNDLLRAILFSRLKYKLQAFTKDKKKHQRELEKLLNAKV